MRHFGFRLRKKAKVAQGSGAVRVHNSCGAFAKLVVKLGKNWIIIKTFLNPKLLFSMAGTFIEKKEGKLH